MHIDGTLVSYTQIETIQGNNGIINKCFMIVQTHGTYPKKVAIQFMNDKINLLQSVRYTEVRVHVNPSSNESNGRWFTNLDGWKVEPIPAASAPTAESMFGAPAANNWGTQPPQPAPHQQFSPLVNPVPQPQLQQFSAPAQQQQFWAPQPTDDVPF